MRTRYSLSLFALFLLASTAFAQTDRGTITGLVADSSGGVVPQVQVTVTNVDTGVVYPGTTNDLGIYSILALPIGTYRVEFKRNGSQTYEQQGVTISIGQAARIEVNLAVGAVAQSVTVKSNASALETETTATDLTVKGTEIETIPFNAYGACYGAYLASMTTPSLMGWQGDAAAGGMFGTHSTIPSARWWGNATKAALGHPRLTLTRLHLRTGEGLFLCPATEGNSSPTLLVSEVGARRW